MVKSKRNELLDMKRILLFVVLSAFAFATVRAAEYTVSLDEVARVLATAGPGDRIIMKNGVYCDLELKWSGRGAENRPVRIEAETPGGVVIEGGSTLRLAGEWLEISGLTFRNGYAPRGSVVEFRCGSEVASDCRLTECVIADYNPARRDTAYSYVLLFGRRNRVDHCEFNGKLNLGVTLIVMLNEERSQRNFHRIDHNVFGYRPVYGSNGAETIRVGTSHQAYESSNTIIEENFFDRCNGEVEVISIKSSDNIIRNNRFWECEGVLALRHGDRNEACGNVFRRQRQTQYGRCACGECRTPYLRQPVLRFGRRPVLLGAGVDECRPQFVAEPLLSGRGCRGARQSFRRLFEHRIRYGQGFGAYARSRASAVRRQYDREPQLGCALYGY